MSKPLFEDVPRKPHLWMDDVKVTLDHIKPLDRGEVCPDCKNRVMGEHECIIDTQTLSQHLLQ